MHVRAQSSDVSGLRNRLRRQVEERPHERLERKSGAGKPLDTLEGPLLQLPITEDMRSRWRVLRRSSD